jgi:hypothetical protein
VQNTAKYNNIKIHKITLGLKVIILSLIITFCAVVAASNASGVEKIVSNSADWRDVYSVMLYSSLVDKQPGYFLTSTKHGTVLLYSIPKGTNGTLVVSSKSQPYAINYKSVMESQDYQNVEEIVTNKVNLELAKRVTKEKNIKKFIVVDDAYGYNALSAASYAVIDRYYVLFVNARNVAEMDTFLTGVNPEKILILGQVDEEVKTRFSKYNIETINKGDRFENNIEMVKKYVKVKPSRQLIMSNGEFIEASIMSGDNPVIFIGRNTVPIQIQEYIKAADFQVAVLIGNELINSATAIRRQLGISVFVKFAQGSRAPTGPIASVEDLDKFPMPRYAVDLGIYSVMYNKATNAIWVTYKNKAGIGAYLKGTITINGNEAQKIADLEPIFIDKNQYKTIIYNQFVDGRPLQIDEGTINAKVYTLFGEGKKSLENVLEATMNVESVEILDSSNINITDVSYDKNKQAFIVEVENIGTVDSYVIAEASDIYINEEYITITSPETTLVKLDKTAKIEIPAVLTESDMANNPTVRIKIYYGERENSLINVKIAEFPFKLISLDLATYGLVLLIIILILLILFGRKKCPHCGYKNPRYKKVCKKCGRSLKSAKHESMEHHPNGPQQ